MFHVEHFCIYAIGQSGNRAIGLLWWDSGCNGFNGFNGFKIVKDS